MDIIATNPAHTIGLMVHVDTTIRPNDAERAATTLGETAWRQGRACFPDHRLTTLPLQRAWIAGWVRLENDARRLRRDTILPFPGNEHAPSAEEIEAARRAGRQIAYTMRIEVYDLTHPRGPRLIQIHQPIASFSTVEIAHQHAQRHLTAFHRTGRSLVNMTTPTTRLAAAA